MLTSAHASVNYQMMHFSAFCLECSLQIPTSMIDAECSGRLILLLNRVHRVVRCCGGVSQQPAVPCLACFWTKLGEKKYLLRCRKKCSYILRFKHWPHAYFWQMLVSVGSISFAKCNAIMWGKPVGIVSSCVFCSLRLLLNPMPGSEWGIPGWCCSSACRGRWFILEVPPFWDL